MGSDEQYLKEAAKIMEAFQKQSSMLQPGATAPASAPLSGNEFDNQGGGEFIKPGEGNVVGTGFDNQGSNNPTDLVQNVNHNPIPNNPNVANPTNTPPPAQRTDVCPQCKSLHPPLNPGQKCPGAGIGEKGAELGIDDGTINKHLVDMRNIIISKMSVKNIKNGKKFFQYAIIELIKSLEKYNE